MARIRADYVFGTTDTALTTGDTTLSSPGLANLPTVSGGDVAAVTLHDGTNYEIVHVTAHTATATTATILRAQEGTTARTWDSGANWNHAPTTVDFATVAVGDTELSPTAVITATKDAGNPTLTETGSMPENILKVDDTYWMLYSRRVSGSYTRLHLASATSPEGPWTPYASNPVLETGDQAWEAADVTNGGCLLEHDGTFYIFYSDGDGSGDQIGVATASAVTGPYTKYASNPILTVGTAGQWDSLRLGEPDVRVVDGTWVMAYMAEDSASAVGTTEKVGIATASDPFGPWTKSASNPVIGFGAASEFDEGGAADPSLFYENGLWWCLYSGLDTGGGKPWQLGLAYADDVDGPWTKHGSNPILTVGGSGAFDELAVWRGALFREGSTYHLPYGGIPASDQSYDAQGGNATLTITPASGGGSGGGASGERLVSNRSGVTSPTTSSTSFVDMDATNLSATVNTPAGGKRYMVTLQARVAQTAAAIACFDFSIDGTRAVSASATGSGVRLMSMTSGTSWGVSIVYVTAVLAEGAHTIKPVWRTNTGTLTAQAGTDELVQFAVVEL